jgi:dTDP-4-dehydrorhamnose 3,5-epimerase
MTFTPLKIAGAWVHEPKIWPDKRGAFHEVFKLSLIKEQLGRDFVVKQVNQSVSKKGVIRGIHYTDSSEGQAKYVSCPKGRIWDVVVDVRKDSQTYGQWDAVELSADNGKSVLIAEGIGHAFLSLEDDSVANYLCSSEFNPVADKTINPLSQGLNIDFESRVTLYSIESFTLSPKDSEAPNF